MNVKLTPEQEKIVTEELKSGQFHSVEEVIALALNALREKARSHGDGLVTCWNLLRRIMCDWKMSPSKI